MIEFEHFLIDQIRQSDATGIYKLMQLNKERFKRFFPITLEHTTTLALSKAFVLEKSIKYKNKQEFVFTLKDKLNNNIIGLIYIKELDWLNKQGEFAYCIDINYNSKGLMQKAVALLTDHAILKLGLEVLQIIVHNSNFASTKIATKCNYTWRKTLIKHHKPPDEDALDMELYELRINEK